MLKCVITGEIPEVPVISKKSGHIFERSLIEKIIRSEGKCPVTNEPLTLDDIVAVQSPEKIVQARAPSDTSIVNLLKIFQNEWDALMLESFKLKKHLHSVRQELSHALYQHDAACRVIARVVKERDQARAELANTQQSMSIAIQGSQRSAMDVDEGGLDEVTISRIKTKSEQLSALRKSNKKVPEKLSRSVIAKWGSHTVKSYHQVGNAGVVSVAIDPKSQSLRPRIFTGGVDCSLNILLYDLTTGAVVKEESLKSHKKKIMDILYTVVGNQQVLVSTAVDGMNLWRRHKDEVWKVTTIAPNGDWNTVLDIHPIGDIFVAGSYKGHVRVYKINGALMCETSFGVREEPIRACKVHPDGALLAAAAGKELMIWHIGPSSELQRVGEVQFKHDGNITSISFSNNGYHLATADENGVVNIWDLRRLKLVTSVSVSSTKKISYNGTGRYLGVGTKDGKQMVFEVSKKEITKVAEYGATKEIGDVVWANTRGGHAGVDADDYLIFSSVKNSNLYIHHEIS